MQQINTRKEREPLRDNPKALPTTEAGLFLLWLVAIESPLLYNDDCLNSSLGLDCPAERCGVIVGIAVTLTTLPRDLSLYRPACICELNLTIF
jgi:hypothetical protein